MCEVLISIIIPVYNNEKTIEKCAQSVCGQNFNNMEVIFVNDGSTDGTADILATIEKQYSFVRIITQKNQGRVCARHNGVKVSKGKYVLFVDSDDWVELNICKEMYDKICKTHSDLVVTGYQDGKAAVLNCFSEGMYRDKEFEELLLNLLIYNGMDEKGLILTTWGKLFRRDKALEVMEIIPSDLYRGEDVAFVYLYLLKCKVVYIMQSALYHYNITSDSTVRKKCPDFLYQIYLLKTTLENHIIDRKDEYILFLKRIWLDIIRLWNNEYKDFENLRNAYYCFDMALIGDKNIILYGAGSVGKDYFFLINKLLKGKLRGWYDIKAPFEYNGYIIQQPSEIRASDDDVVLIAVNDNLLAEKIIEELVEKFGIRKECIIWSRPDCLWL